MQTQDISICRRWKTQPVSICLTRQTQASSSNSRSNRRDIYFYNNATHYDCHPPLRVHGQIAWTPINPGRRFKACPIYDMDQKCGFYGFTDIELPSDCYKDLLYNIHEKQVIKENGKDFKFEGSW
uniref:Uncharacterized protein n=1 Tax=Tanacetum cinerariifolium TaxID=118510 RepID=A0A6L2P2A1_TANCI|nr:hypothetical protein CTI12_AA549320 [Tanacetum cinerariifolium]